MNCWVVWNAFFNYIYEFLGEFGNSFSIVYYEVFLTLRAKFFPVSFIQNLLGKVVILRVQTLESNWEMVAPACVIIHPPGEIKEQWSVAEG